MQLVIADTGPINYLILIGHIDLLPHMFERVALPKAVQAELSISRAPLPVQRWIAAPPVWLEIHDTTGLPLVSGLDDGETAAIALAESLHADLLLIDERDGSRVAHSRAAERGLVEFSHAIQKLERTNFHRPEAVLAKLLAKYKGTQKP